MKGTKETPNPYPVFKLKLHARTYTALHAVIEEPEIRETDILMTTIGFTMLVIPGKVENCSGYLFLGVLPLLRMMILIRHSMTREYLAMLVLGGLRAWTLYITLR